MTPPITPATTGFSGRMPVGDAKVASSQGMNTARARISLPLLGSVRPMSTVADRARATGAGASRLHIRNAESSAKEAKSAWKLPRRPHASRPLHAATRPVSIG